MHVTVWAEWCQGMELSAEDALNNKVNKKLIACIYATVWCNKSFDRRIGLLKWTFKSKVSFAITAVAIYSENCFNIIRPSENVSLKRSLTRRRFNQNSVFHPQRYNATCAFIESLSQ
jgi:hypothetical protein